MLRQTIASRLLLVVLLLVQLAAAENKALAGKIEKLLAEPDVARGIWGIDVISLKSGKTLYSLNGDKLFTPASNTKLFTTAAAFALIGGEYKFRTTIETNGAVDRYGRLTGDLILVGRGDPNLSGRVLPYKTRTERKLPSIDALESLADQLVRKGLKYVDGDVVADDTYFAFERYGEGWTQDDLVWEWGAPVSALTINDNVVFVSILPADRPGDRAFVQLIPHSDYYRIDNRIITTPSGTGPRKIYINREPGSNVLTVWGSIALDDAGANEALAIENPAEFAAKYFRTLLEKRGVVIYGSTRARHTELAKLGTFSVTTSAPVGGGDALPYMPRTIEPAVLAEHQSVALSNDLRVINKVSQNLHAELLLRLLGRERGNSGTIESGLEVVRGFMHRAGIKQDEFVFYDGSGLSRQNLVTPKAVTRLLVYSAAQPWAPLFRDTLPVAGIDGSLGERFKNSPVQGRVTAKTGSLGHVNALAGYATTEKGEEVAFAIVANNHNLSGKRALETIDRIVEAIIDDSKK